MNLHLLQLLRIALRSAFSAGHFLDNFDGHDSIINTISINEDNVMFTGGDDGSMQTFGTGIVDTTFSLH